MIKFLSLLITLFSFNFMASSIEEEKFLEVVNNCYDQYKIVFEEPTVVGDINIVFGIKNKDYYISAFFLNQSYADMTLQFYINDKLEKTFVEEGTVINAFGVEVDRTDFVTVVIHHESQNIKYSLNISELVSDNSSFQNGLGQDKFPKNKLETDVIKILRLIIVGFGLLSCIFVFIIIYFYRKRKGRFNESNKQVIDVVGEYYQEYGDPNVDSKEEIQKINKQELMDRYFDEYRSGDITEEELNEKLKRLWWQDDKN